jgi:hypothetical protein
VADESGMTDPLAAILKELRLMKNEIAANKAEFDAGRSDAGNPRVYRSDTESTARSHVAEAEQAIVQHTESKMAGAAVDQPVAEMPQTGGSGDSPGGDGGNVPHSQMSAETV